MKVLNHLPACLFVAGGISIRSVVGLSSIVKQPSLTSLLAANRDTVASLKTFALGISTDEYVAPRNDVFYLRYALDDSKANDDERFDALRSTLTWRANEGLSIVTSARRAVNSALAGETWNNDPVRDSAPHSDVVRRYFTTEQCITTTLPSTGDLVYCIRAGRINDVGLMSDTTIEQMVDFFIYCKEVNSAVADLRSLKADVLVKLITCNDLAGVKLVGGSPDLRKSLSAASKKANELYPTFNGRTLMLNPPVLLGVLAKLFTPLFPEAVRNRLRFESGPLKDVGDLREISIGGEGRDDFVNQVDALAYD